MLIKEYRIPLPLTVEEYRIAQLYMIAKKSREESKGAGSGVEIMVNEPYADGPGGRGQYTHKIYHVGSHLPGWFKSLLPKSALQVEEEAWNAYPYTKTRFTCPFVDRFSLEIETKYLPDAGHQDNVFSLSPSDLRARIIDLIDVVKDQMYGSDYSEEEDPGVFQSEKTGRGPLTSCWLDDYSRECVGKPMPTDSGKAIMCAYKLCRVEFRYWGMQSKIEKFIHDVALRKTMLRAHQQAWAWQDEWHGLTLEDIRRIERETQEALARTMGGGDEAGETPETPPNSDTQPYVVTEDKPVTEPAESAQGRNDQLDTMGDGRKKVWSRSSSKSGLSTLGKDAVRKSLDLQMTTWRMESIRRDSDTSSNEDDEFFDCQEEVSETTSLTRWSSLELVPADLDTPSRAPRDDSIFSSENIGRPTTTERSKSVPRSSLIEAVPTQHQTSVCPTTILILVFHAGSVLDPSSDLTAKRSDLLTFRAALDAVSRQHYPPLLGHVTTRLVPCPPLPQEALAALSSMSPYSFDVSPSSVDGGVNLPRDAIPVGAIPLLMTSSHDYNTYVNDAIKQANQQYHEFLNSPDGVGFSGQICVVGDSVGAILAYDALCRASPSDFSQDTTGPSTSERIPAGKLCQRSLSDVGTSAIGQAEALIKNKGEPHLDFEVDDFFMFGSSLALVLAHRKIAATVEQRNAPPMRPWVGQLYNLFHPSDPLASRLEPLLSAKFSLLQPLTVPRYQKYPLGDGRPLNVLEFIQSSWALFAGEGSVTSCSPSRLTINTRMRRISDSSVHSLDATQLHSITQLASRWWGKKRLDFALYCPEGLASFPSHALPHLFHASFWESQDVMAFICRQLVRNEGLSTEESVGTGAPLFTPSQPKEKWLRKRTSVKLKNVAANHRANDVIVREGTDQAITARFMYGPLDMVALTGEKVDIHIMKTPPGGDWTYLATEVTDKNGRVSYTLPPDQTLGYGMYPVKCVVRGDHTCIDFYLMVIPPKTECVVFSIDGSFTASVSVTGKDPKVRPGAVDVVRHWQEMGYVIVYITGRPDMQQQQVVSWLAQHNFPHGLVSFADGLSTDPLGHKADYLRKLIKEMDMVIHAGYGSSKDIGVYASVGLKPDSIFVVGKVSRKQQQQAHVLSDGYAMHLGELPSLAISRPSQCNARMLIQTRGCFGLPGQRSPVRRQRNTFTRSASLPKDFRKREQAGKYALQKVNTISSMDTVRSLRRTIRYFRCYSLPKDLEKPSGP